MIVHSKKTGEIIEGIGFSWLLGLTLETVLHISDVPVVEEIAVGLLLLLTRTTLILPLVILYLKLPKEVLFLLYFLLLTHNLCCFLFLSCCG